MQRPSNRPGSAGVVYIRLRAHGTLQKKFAFRNKRSKRSMLLEENGFLI